MSFDFDFIKKINDNNKKYFEMINLLKIESKEIIENWNEEPYYISGWRHNYFCDDDGAFLKFNIKSYHQHQCPKCNRIYNGQEKKNAWVNIMRNKALFSGKSAALIYKIYGDKEYLEFAKKLIMNFVNNYENYPIHIKDRVLDDVSEYVRLKRDVLSGKIDINFNNFSWKIEGYDLEIVGPGKIMSQGLSEAIAIIRLLFIYEMIKEEFTEEEKKDINKKLLNVSIELLEPQQVCLHNISLWREVAIVIMYIVKGDYTNELLERKLGIYHHIDNAVSEDGIWYEGSIHYNFYILEALMYLSVFMKIYGIKNHKLESKLEQMLSSICNFSFDNGILPNPNDGWPNVNLKTYIQVFEMAHFSYENNSVISDIYKYVRELKIDRIPLPIEDEYYYEDLSLTGLILSKKDTESKTHKKLNRAGYCYSKSKFAMIRNDKFNVFLKYGVLSPSHAHFDPLNIEFTINNNLISKDLSNSGYGSEIFTNWYNTPIGHNSIIINEGVPNVLYDAIVTNFDNDKVEVEANNIYNLDEKYIRKLYLSENEFFDEVTVNIRSNEQVDYVLHFDGSEFEFTDEDLSKSSKSELGYKSTKAEYMNNIRKVKDREKFSMINRKFRYDVEFDILGKELFIIETPGNPAEEIRTTVLIRSKDTNRVRFKTKIRQFD